MTKLPCGSLPLLALLGIPILQCIAVGSAHAQPGTVGDAAAAAAAAVQESWALQQQQQGQRSAQAQQGQYSLHQHEDTAQQSSGQCSATAAVLPDERKPAEVLPGPGYSASSDREELARDYAAMHQAGQSHNTYLPSRDFVSSSTDPGQRLLDWMRHNGAIINVSVTYAGPQYGRVVVASQPTTRGDLLAAIPLELTWSAAASGGNMQVAAANFWAEIDNPDSPWCPYLDALPSQDELVCPLVSMPREYQHLLQSEEAVRLVEGYQGEIMGFWEQYGGEMMATLPSMTLDTFKYARALLTTRLFGLDSGSAMVPLLDLANHAPNCPNTHSTRECPHEPGRMCLMWTAGAFQAEGAEVCNGYKFMPNDRSMLQYGFLQSGPIKDHLHTIDFPGANHTTMFSLFNKMKYGPPAFDGTVGEIEAEVSRLEATLANITAGDAAAAVTQAVPSDKGGRILSLMLMWREERRAALKLEVARLQKRLAELAKAAAGTEQQEVPPEEDLMQWLTAHGAQVKGLRIGVQSTTTTTATGPTRAAAPDRCGVFAAQPIKQGSLLAAIPLDLALPVNAGDLLGDGPTLFSEITNPVAPRAAYYAALPSFTEVFSIYKMPVEYAPVVQHAATGAFVRSFAATLVDVSRTHAVQFTSRQMTLQDLQHVLSLVDTRQFHFKEGPHLVPLIDSASHRNGCPHRIEVQDCAVVSEMSETASKGLQSGPSILNNTRVCVVWTAGSNLSAGEEVCVSHGHLLPDRAMLQYGFIPPELQELQPEQQQLTADGTRIPLFGMDRHDFAEAAEAGLPLRAWLDRDTSPEPFTGSRAEIASEVMRLQLLADELSTGDAAAAAVMPVTSVDPDGSVLHKLRFWRRLRKAAVAQELQRLRQQL